MARRNKKTVRKKVQEDTKIVRRMSNIHRWAVNELERRERRGEIDKKPS